jgi:hypothetical protein
VAWIDDAGEIGTVPLDQLSEAVLAGRIGPETKVFDNLVSTRKDYLHRWVVPLRESWMKRFA